MYIEFVQGYVPNTTVLIAKGQPISEIFECPEHLHDDIEILICTKGVREVSVKEKTVVLSVGDIIVINRRVPHSTRDLEPYTTVSMLQFRTEKIIADDFEHINRYLSILLAANENEFVYIKKNHSTAPIISELANKMIEENSLKRKNYDLFIRGYMNILLGVLYRNDITSDIRCDFDSDSMQRIYPVIEHIDKHYTQQFTLDELSHLLNMNPSYFCRLFKKATTVTPMEYINFVRIYKAENLLISTDMSVLEISMAVGFSSVSYFNRTFKKLKNTTPTAYRTILYAKNKLI